MNIIHKWILNRKLTKDVNAIISDVVDDKDIKDTRYLNYKYPIDEKDHIQVLKKTHSLFDKLTNSNVMIYPVMNIDKKYIGIKVSINF